MDKITTGFDGLVTAETFAEVREIPEEYIIIDTKWLYMIHII